MQQQYMRNKNLGSNEEFANSEEMQTYLLLTNYVNNAHASRGWLLRFMFQTLKDLDSRDSFIFEDITLTLKPEDKGVLRCMIQIDIISKIMMYVEDLVIILEAMRTKNGNYYPLLDNLDVGGAIKEFFDKLETFDVAEWRRMLNYLDPDSNSISDKWRPILKKLIESNINSLKESITDIRSFSKTHHPIYKRFKHAGFPMRLGVKSSNPFPFTTRNFELYTMVSAGESSVSDAVMLPYSLDVIESYKILLPSLQHLILDIIENKLLCISRRIDGVVPTKSYRPANFYTPEEDKEIKEMIQEFYNREQVRYTRPYNFELNANYMKRMTWYIELDQNMRRWKEKKERERQ